MKIGYARTSTMEQVAGLEAQVRELKANGCDKIFQEQLSSVDAKRAQLEAAIEFCREGDVLVCMKLDRLARSVANVVEIGKRLREKGAAILILDPRLSNASPAEELTFNILASIAQFERQIMLERQREGIAKAKSEGKYKGRAPTARAKADEVRELMAAGVGATEIAKRLKIGRRSVYRVAGQPSA
jgi:DNA invertase Pin-like site-specific DNA recombinase